MKTQFEVRFQTDFTNSGMTYCQLEQVFSNEKDAVSYLEKDEFDYVGTDGKYHHYDLSTKKYVIVDDPSEYCDCDHGVYVDTHSIVKVEN